MVSNPFSEGIAVNVTGDASSATTAIQSVMGSLTSMRGLALGAGVGIAAALGVQSVNAAREFDAAMTESLAIMGDVSETMREDMAGAAREVAKQTTFSANEAAESYFFLASAGLDATQAIAAMPEVARFAQAGMFDMARATDLLTDAASALGLEISEYNRLADVLVKANTLANASVEQFSSALTRQAATSMRNANIAVEEGVAVLAAWADQGIKGERAGSLFRRTIDQLQEAAIENTETFEEYGISVFDAEGGLRNMADIVGDLEGAFGDLSVEQRAAALEQLGFSIRTREGILALLGNSEALREYQSELEDAQGTTEEVADKQLESFNSQLDLLQSRLNDVAIEIGRQMLPALEDLVRDTIKAIDTTERWGRTLDTLVDEHLGPYIEKMNEAGFSNRELARASTNLTNPLNIALIIFDELRGAGERLSDTYIELGNRADRIEDNWDAAFDTLDEGEETTRRAGDAASEASEKFKRLTDIGRDLRDKLISPSAIEQVSDAFLNMGDVSIGLSDEARDLRSAFLGERQELTELESQLAQTSAELRGLGRAHDELGDKVRGNRIEIMEIRLQARQEGRELTDAEKRQIEELRLANDELRLEQLKLTDQQDDLKEKQQEQEKAVKDQKEEVQDAKGAFTDFMEELARKDPDTFAARIATATDKLKGFRDVLFDITGTKTLAKLNEQLAGLDEVTVEERVSSMLESRGLLADADVIARGADIPARSAVIGASDQAAREDRVPSEIIVNVEGDTGVIRSVSVEEVNRAFTNREDRTTRTAGRPA